MIKKILHTQKDQAEAIRAVFQISYKVEAELLGAASFPPLYRPLEEFYNCPNDFIGYHVDEKLVAVVEIKNEENSMHIQSLVVDPEFFRRGIARKLIEFVLQHYAVKQFTVETGKDNGPARKLYESFGFELLKTYTADEGILKVRYQKQL